MPRLMSRCLKSVRTHSVSCVMCLLLFGCGRLPFAPVETAPVRNDVTAAQLSAATWTAQSGIYHLRQTVVFEFRGARVPMIGMMRLDLGQRKARLVAVNDLGVKFFDLEVDETGVVEHYLLPNLAQFAHFSEAVASSVRRVFLAPHPSRNDTLTLDVDHYVLQRPYNDGTVHFVFAGRQPQLVETEVATEHIHWRARYFEYRRFEPISYPRGIIFDDDMAGFRLTMWLEGVEKVDE